MPLTRLAVVEIRAVTFTVALAAALAVSETVILRGIVVVLVTRGLVVVVAGRVVVVTRGLVVVVAGRVVVVTRGLVVVVAGRVVVVVESVAGGSDTRGLCQSRTA